MHLPVYSHLSTGLYSLLPSPDCRHGLRPSTQDNGHHRRPHIRELHPTEEVDDDENNHGSHHHPLIEEPGESLNNSSAV